MNIKTRSINFDVTPAIDSYVTKKLESLSKFLSSDSHVLCEVELGKTTQHHKSGDIFKAEVNITHAGEQFYALAERSDLYAAIDEVRDEIERLIVSKKKKKDTLFKRGAMRIKNLLKRYRA